MRPLLLALCVLVIPASSADAQSEAALRAALEGKTVTVKIEMPGTSRGIDVFPQDAAPVNWREVADRLKANATSLRIGQTVMITKVVLNRDSHIEVQLGGGGFGTFGDNTGSEVSATYDGESPREKALRDSIKSAPTPQAKKKFESSLNSLRSEREQRNDHARAAASTANEAREANLRIRRAEGGSRFNVRYRRGIPSDAMTPNGLIDALSPYIDFGGGTHASSTNASRPAAPSGSPMLTLKKGMSIADVEALLGPANTATESKEGVLTLMRRTYTNDSNRIITSFVNGVMIDFVIAPQ